LGAAFSPPTKPTSGRGDKLPLLSLTMTAEFENGGRRVRLREFAMEPANRMVGASAIGAAMLIGLCTPSAQAGFVVDLTQEGSNVVATGSGAIDLTGLEFLFSSRGVGLLSPNNGTLAIGSGVLVYYAGAVSGPANFGSGGQTLSSSNTGGPVEIFSPALGVPSGYVSDSPLSETSTYLSQTFSSLGVTPGTYKWTWGSGANQNFTLITLGTAGIVPEPSTWAMVLLGFAGLGLAGFRSVWRRRRTACNV
jgi:hypothetical protein